MSKVTNMEHFRKDIEAVEYDFALYDGQIGKCRTESCSDCDFIECDKDCSTVLIEWLMSEYKEDPVLTAREKSFVEFAQDGWLTRDEDGELWWYRDKPKKRESSWSVNGVTYSFRGILNFKQYFRFITWEDESPWSIEELRKLKVK